MKTPGYLPLISMKSVWKYFQLKRAVTTPGLEVLVDDCGQLVDLMHVVLVNYLLQGVHTLRTFQYNYS